MPSNLLLTTGFWDHRVMVKYICCKFMRVAATFICTTPWNQDVSLSEGQSELLAVPLREQTEARLKLYSALLQIIVWQNHSQAFVSPPNC